MVDPYSTFRLPFPTSHPNLTSFQISHSPPKIKSIRIVDNPFDDIVPRITAAEKRAQQRAREEAQKEREEAERRRGAKKFAIFRWFIWMYRSLTMRCRNVKLLSFGADEDGAEDSEPTTFKKKPIFRTDRERLDSFEIPDPLTLLIVIETPNPSNIPDFTPNTRIRPPNTSDDPKKETKACIANLCNGRQLIRLNSTGRETCQEERRSRYHQNS